MPFTCPRCGRTSHNPNDMAQNYCGHCHVFLDDVGPPLSVKPGPPIDKVPLRRGDFVTIRAEGRELDAMVTLASTNGRSLVVMFDAILGGFVQAMPVLQHDDGSWAALTGMPVEIRRKERH